MGTISNPPHHDELPDPNRSGWAQALRFTAPDGSRRCATSNRRRTRRRGSLYVAVLGVTMIVGMMALAAMHVVRMHLKASTGRNDRYDATVLASSGVENGLMVVENTPAWRTSLASGTAYPASPVTLGRGTFTWKLVDADGNLADDPSDSVLLQGIGRVGGVTHVEQVRLQPTDVGLTCLQASLHSQGNIVNGISISLTTNQMVSSNGLINVTSGGSSINGNAEAVGSITGNVSGTKTSGITPRQMPGSDVFDYYVNMGTQIDMNLLPLESGKRMLQNVVLSPQSNPYGNPNPEGIYVIDCKGQVIRIKLVRVLGTIVLLNPGFGSDLDNDIHWEPAVPNFPALMVKGHITFNWHGEHDLRESMAGVNYNPPGTPYKGQEDTDMIDTYPPRIKGLTYVSGTLSITHECILRGSVVVGGTPIILGNMTLTYDAVHLNYPPPGFAAGSTMRIAPGSWVRAASP